MNRNITGYRPLELIFSMPGFFCLLMKSCYVSDSFFYLFNVSTFFLNDIRPV